MGDLIFSIKTVVTTFAIVVLFQIKVGEGTIEDHTMNWIHQSSLMAPVQEAAQGGVIGIRELWQRLTSGINTKFSNAIDKGNIPGSRTLGPPIERSRAYLKRQAELATQKIKEEVGDSYEEMAETVKDETSSEKEWTE